jgi:hypothetical protein
VAHYPGGKVLVPQPGPAPVPCGVSTGFAAAENHVVVTDAGSVIYTPAVLPSGLLGTGGGPDTGPDPQANANPAGLAVSADGGGHWSLVRPYGITWNPTDHGDYVDPRTGRFFFEDYGPIPSSSKLGLQQEGPAHLIWSDDTRSWHHVALTNLAFPENPKFTSGPAPAGRPHPVGYPDVVYFCANTNVGFTSPAIVGRLCFRSLDGGASWHQASQLFNAVIPEHPECGTNGEVFSAVDGYYPESAPDGTLYVLVSCGGKTYLARSTDEAATFPIIHTRSGPVQLSVPVDSITSALGSGPQLRIDPNNNLYLLYPRVEGRTITKLFLRISPDGGRTWSRPADLTAPGVTGVLRWSVSERGVGHLVVSYLGHRNAQTTWDGYLTETRDALDALKPGGGPLLWSAATNRHPLMYADHISGAGYVLGQGQIQVPYPFPLGIQPLAGPVNAGNDFLGSAIGPDGTAWGGFNQDCGPTPNAPGCQADHDQTRGFVARLVWR